VNLPFHLASLRSRRASFVRSHRALAAAAALVTTALGVAGCTETPDYFPPCVENAPCEAADSAADASDAGRASEAASADAVGSAADMALEAAPGDP